MFRSVLFFSALASLALADTLFFKPSSQGQADVVCPDQKYSCPNGQTCCPQPSGGYGCCPLPQASCCPDHLHCCPHDYTCDTKSGQCQSTAGLKKAWLEKRPAKLNGRHSVTAIVCPGGEYKCPSGNTCCKQGSGGGWACCPFVKATCCSDGKHCCPSGYNCDASHGTCTKAGAKTVLLGKLQEAPRVRAVPATKHTQPNTKTVPQGKKVGGAPIQKQKPTLKAPQKVPAKAKPKLAGKVVSKQAAQTPKPCSHSRVNVKLKAQKPLASSVPRSPPKRGGVSATKPNIPKAKQPLKQTVKKVVQTKKPVNVKVKPHIVKTVPLKKAQPIIAQKTRQPVKKVVQTGGAKAPKKTQEKTSQKTKVPPKTQDKKPAPTKDKSETSNKSVWKAEKTKKMSERLTDAIQATVSAIKDKVHRVLGGRGSKTDKGKSQQKTDATEKKAADKPKSKPADVAKEKQKLDNVLKKKKMAIQSIAHQKLLHKLALQKIAQQKLPHTNVAQQKLTHQNMAQQKQTHKKLAKQQVLSQKLKLTLHKPLVQQKLPNIRFQPGNGTHKAVLNRKNLAQTKIVPQKLAQKQKPVQKQGKQTQMKIKQLGQKLVKAVNPTQQAKAQQQQKIAQQKQKVTQQQQKVAQQQHKVTQQHQKVTQQQHKVTQHQKVTQQQHKVTQHQKVTQQQLQKQQQLKLMQDNIRQQQVHQQKLLELKIQQIKLQQQKQRTQTKKHTLGVGRKLLGIAWRFFAGGESPEDVEEIPYDATNDVIDYVDISQGDDIDGPPPKSSILLPPENEFEIVEENFVNEVVGKDIVCPDKSECPGDATCCKLESGGYGCCPVADAVCCKDNVHCCPEDSKCDLEAGTCVQETNAVSWSLKQPALEKKANDVGNIICPGGQSVCPDESTCCRMKSGVWGCCPMPDAICCNDHLHCCPTGTTCNTRAGMCEDLTSSLQISHTLIIPRAKVEMNMAYKLPSPPFTIVKCDDGTECPDGSTCCQNSAGKYACCPHTEGVCCADKINCCPKGFTCDMKSKNKCSKPNPSILNSILFFQHPTVQSAKIQLPGEQFCPDQETSCPNGNTCCAMENGGYGCCGLKEAVCCASGFCCPKGHTCDNEGNKCLVSIPLLTKIPAKKVVSEDKRENTLSCPNKHYSCPEGNTCCHLQDDTWGCCASNEAVCCPKGPYCCPKSTTCSDKEGECEQEDSGSDSAKHAAAFLRRAVKGGNILY